MAELEKLKADERMYKAFATQESTAQKALARAYKSVRDLEGTGETELGDDAWKLYVLFLYIIVGSI